MVPLCDHHNLTIHTLFTSADRSGLNPVEIHGAIKRKAKRAWGSLWLAWVIMRPRPYACLKLFISNMPIRGRTDVHLRKANMNMVSWGYSYGDHQGISKTWPARAKCWVVSSGSRMKARECEIFDTELGWHTCLFVGYVSRLFPASSW